MHAPIVTCIELDTNIFTGKHTVHSCTYTVYTVFEDTENELWRITERDFSISLSGWMNLVKLYSNYEVRMRGYVEWEQ